MSKETKRKRKPPTPKTQLQVFKRDNYTCKTCGKSPVTYPGLFLEVDHIFPFSLGGIDELANYQTLCMLCNRGKGNNEHLNRTVNNDLNAILNKIHPEILNTLTQKDEVSVIANQEDYTRLIEKNSLGEFYKIIPSTNTIIGYQTCKSLGLYTIQDNHGCKVHFFISKLAF